MGTFDLPSTDSFRFQEARNPDLKIEAWSNAERIVQLRGFTKDAQLQLDHTTNSDRSVSTQIMDLTDYPIFLSVAAPATAVKRGELYVRLTLQNSGVDVGRLIAGYVTDGSGRTWPGSTLEGFTDGKGLIRTISGTNPAAGVEIAETVPTNARWAFRAIRFSFITNGTGANRTVRLLLDDGASAYHLATNQAFHTAGQTRVYNFMVGGQDLAAVEVDQFLVRLGNDMIMSAGHRVRTNTDNLVAGDDYAAPVYLVEEWIEE